MNQHPSISMDGNLACPHCSGDYMHQEAVKVYSRPKDANQVIVTTVTADSVERRATTTVEITDGSGNPSARRHGVTIHFRCENCGNMSDLVLGQHKGLTEVSWR